MILNKQDMAIDSFLKCSTLIKFTNHYQNLNATDKINDTFLYNPLFVVADFDGKQRSPRTKE